jgi:hypothetical protein
MRATGTVRSRDTASVRRIRRHTPGTTGAAKNKEQKFFASFFSKRRLFFCSFLKKRTKKLLFPGV